MEFQKLENEEIWKDIKGLERQFQVSNLGRVKGLERYVLQHNGKKVVSRPIKEHIMTINKTPKGQNLRVSLRDGQTHKSRSYSIERLVATAFISNPQGYKYVIHKDGNKTNNNVDNLTWSISKYKKPDINKLIEDAKKYKNGVELSKANQWLYNQIQSRGLIPIVYVDSHKCHNKLTLEEVLKVANTCENYNDFYKKYPSAYAKVLSERWQDYLPFKPKNIITDKIYKVYAYIFENENAYYVGLTRTNKRDKEHRNGNNRSSVYDFEVKRGIKGVHFYEHPFIYYMIYISMHYMIYLFHLKHCLYLFLCIGFIICNYIYYI